MHDVHPQHLSKRQLSGLISSIGLKGEMGLAPFGALSLHPTAPRVCFVALRVLLGAVERRSDLSPGIFEAERSSLDLT